MSKQHYFLGHVEVLAEEHLRCTLTTALISKSGVHKIFADTAPVQKAFLKGRVFFIKIEGEIRRARLVREEGVEGVHYNLHILRTEEDLVLVEHLLAKGFQSPWKREFPRISVQHISGDVDKPARVIFPRVTGPATCEVVNFSFHGMLFEFPCSRISLGENIGQQIRFSILSSQQSQIEVRAKITRIYDEMLAPGKLVRGLGVKFLDWEKQSQKRYQDLILEACKDMKRRN